MKLKLNTLTVILFLIQNFVQAATCTAVASANWTLASTWSCGHVPLCSDDIVIPTGYTVTITTNIDLNTTGCALENTIITINGQLFMSGNVSRLQLPAAATITINSGGRLHTDITNNSQKIIIGSTGNAEWDSNIGDLTGPWHITDNNSEGTLPIELIEFKATCKNSDIQLNWITASEKNNDYFLIERSNDANYWEIINKISGNGDKSSITKYDYIDKNAFKDQKILYYRLTQVDFDGTKEVFNLIDIECNNSISSSFILYPNPLINEINFLVNNLERSKRGRLFIIDTYGSVVFEKELSLIQGMNEFKFPIDLKNGIYSIQLTTDAEQIPAQKMIVAQP